jgi:hypothetical protein
LYTFNVADYCVLHQSWISRKRAHTGISVAPEIRRLMRLIGTVTAEEIRNRFEFLSAWR